jgi:hypothetical protein
MDDFVTPGVAAAASAVIGVTILGVAVLGLIFAFQRRVFGSSGGARAFAGAPAPAADRATVPA